MHEISEKTQKCKELDESFMKKDNHLLYNTVADLKDC